MIETKQLIFNVALLKLLLSEKTADADTAVPFAFCCVTSTNRKRRI
ncbi:MAG: hypothetical protein GX685_04445 [Clostridiales bacterium]|nr:hypothetical protein [Clostridiales bacterium]